MPSDGYADELAAGLTEIVRTAREHGFSVWIRGGILGADGDVTTLVMEVTAHGIDGMDEYIEVAKAVTRDLDGPVRAPDGASLIERADLT